MSAAALHRFASRVRLGGAGLVLAAIAPSARAGVVVVDRAGGAGAFPTIAAAVAAAVEGDTILVRPGAYVGSFVIAGKSLSVVADGPGVTLSGGTIFNERTIEVRDLTAAQSVTVRGLATDTGVVVRNCDGSVWFDQLSVDGYVSCGVGGVDGAYVENSPSVTFTRCLLVGESDDDIWSQHPSADGLDARSSTVQLFDCHVQGGWGQDEVYLSTATRGGAGLRLEQSTVTVVGCALQGGEGGVNRSWPCTGTMEPGGPGVLFVNGSGILRSAESTAVGGVANLGPMCPGQTGPSGPPIEGNGTVVALPGFARHLEATSPVRGGESLTFDVEGRPGELPVILTSTRHEPLFLAALSGVLVVGLPPADVFVLAPLPADGHAALAFPVQAIGPGVGALTYCAQALFLDPAARLWLGAGSTTVLLDGGL